ncbi:nuclear transport factor 2 family protein [Aphanothece hegewaldii]|nr:nuclear transport factor 2 family protein [Aphanothece hegewaldii]
MILILGGISVIVINIEKAITTPDPVIMSNIISPVLIRSLIEQAKDSWINGNAESFAALFTSDGEFIVPGNRWKGQQAIKQAAADFANNTSSVKIEIHRIIIEGNQAVVEWYWEDTAKVTGQKSPADDAIVIDFVDDKIKRWREYIDTKTPLSNSTQKG